MVGDIRKQTLTLHLTGSDTKQVDKSTRAAQIRETEKITNTVIRQVKEARTAKKVPIVKVRDENTILITS